MNNNISRMFCTKIELLTRKTVLKVSIISNFLSEETPVKLRNSQIPENCQLLLQDGEKMSLSHAFFFF